ncbi:MAG: GspE/PulE family protein [candidate division WOR-3 bacterium]
MFLQDFLKEVQKLTKIPLETLKSYQEESVTKRIPFDIVLLEKGVLDSKTIAQIKAKILKQPFEVVTDPKVPYDILNIIPLEIVTSYKVVPLGKAKDDKLKVGMVYPEDIEAEEAIDFISLSKKIPFEKYVISADDFNKISRQYSSLKTEIKSALEGIKEEYKTPEPSIEAEENINVEKFQKLAEQAPITKVVDVILKYAVDLKASDIHIEPLTDQIRVRFRIDGVLHSSIFLPKNILAAIVTRIKILSNLKIDETRIPQDGRIHQLIDKRLIDYRVSTFPVSEGEKVVMRVLDTAKAILTLEDLGLEGKSLEDVKKAIDAPFGQILITGPTGSGKSTTLYAILSILNQDDTNIITLEDPVEYYIAGVNQSQVRPEIGYTFATGLRHILRQDPDIIMVGEIRDNETAELATHAALTGHLVFSTLHTNDAIGIIPRLNDMGIEDFLLPSSLKLGVAQRLVRKLCPACKKKIEIVPQVKEIIDYEISMMPPALAKKIKEQPLTLYKAPGCAECGNKGTSGRIGIFETLYMTKELENIIINKISTDEIQKEAKNQGMVTMRQDGIIKALRGIVSFDEVIKSTEQSYKK